MANAKDKALKMYKKGLSPAEIARKLGKPYATVYNWVVRRNTEIPKKKEKENETALRRYTLTLSQSPLGEKLERFLFMVRQIKGSERVGSLYQFYRENRDEIIQVLGKRIGKSRFYQLVNFYVMHRFGSVAKLELKRRPKSAFKHIIKAGTIKREKGLWEIDGTGYTFQDKLYAVLFCIDTYSGYIIDYLFVEAREATGAKHYNKAFNSLSVGAWLQKIFIEHGVPEKLRYDNEKVLLSEYIKNALKELKIDCKRVPPYNPNKKLIERAIGTIKNYLLVVDKDTFQEALQEAVSLYNKEQHHFKHGIIRPIELFEPGRRVDEETIRYAFAEKFVRVLRDSVIQIDNLKYECIWYRERLGDTGRLERGIEVICVRYVDDVSRLEVFDKETGEFLGTARLVSLITLQKTPTTEIKESIAKDKRAKKRLAKLEEEATIIKGQIQPNGIVAVYSVNGDGKGIGQRENNEEILPGLLEIFG